VLALVGTANVLPVAAVAALPGVVLALDGDGPGAAAARELRADLAIAGVPTVLVSPGWLGHEGAKDPADLACLAQRGEAGADAYARAIAAVEDACTYACAGETGRGAGQRGTVLREHEPVTCTEGWDEEAVQVLLTAMYGRIAEASRTLSIPAAALQTDDLDAAIDTACQARDWRGLHTAVHTYERVMQEEYGVSLRALESSCEAC
jgi:hypothetical protein